MQPRCLVTVEELVASFVVSDRREHPHAKLRPEYAPDKPAAVSLPGMLARNGIALPFHALEGTSYRYQIGISYETENPNFVEWRERCSEIEPSGDDLSGVVILDGSKVIAGYTAKGYNKRPSWVVGVHPDYRGQGLSTRAILEWFKAAPWLNLVGWPTTTVSAKAFVSAHRQYVEWAVAQGEPVPQNVIDSVRAQP